LLDFHIKGTRVAIASTSIPLDLDLDPAVPFMNPHSSACVPHLHVQLPQHLAQAGLTLTVSQAGLALTVSVMPVNVPHQVPPPQSHFLHSFRDEFSDANIVAWMGQMMMICTRGEREGCLDGADDDDMQQGGEGGLIAARMHTHTHTHTRGVR
jgi:hypothetical protein